MQCPLQLIKQVIVEETVTLTIKKFSFQNKTNMPTDKLDLLCQLLEVISVHHGKEVEASAPEGKKKPSVCSSKEIVVDQVKNDNESLAKDHSNKKGKKISVNKKVNEDSKNIIKQNIANTTLKEIDKSNLCKQIQKELSEDSTFKSKPNPQKFNSKKKHKSENEQAENFTSVEVKINVTNPGNNILTQNLNETNGCNDKESSSKSKAELKRERREKQESQRQAKEVGKLQKVLEKKPAVPVPSKQINIKKITSASGSHKKKQHTEGEERQIPLLGHLTALRVKTPLLPMNSETIHPAIRVLGLQFKERIIDGSTARVLATLVAIKRVINDYRTPESCDLSRDLNNQVIKIMEFLTSFRTPSVAVDNTIRFMKHQINSVSVTTPEAQAKTMLCDAIHQYIQENIILASSSIASHAAVLIDANDVILTYGYSALVVDVIEKSLHNGCRPSVVVIDAAHPASGITMVDSLTTLGVSTHYKLITDVSHIMHKVTKVIIEAEAVMMNGAVQAACGTAVLALAARTHDTPVIVLCHTYKFCNNDLTDSLVVNELGDAEHILSCPVSNYKLLLDHWQECQNLNIINMVYDVTPSSLVTVLVTEQSVLPTSAVPVIIQRNYADILGQD